ncbi:zinc finger CCCH-type with G patch domain-containing protein-like isoform X2 [Ylistrum balloti]|uniref:zinc finger CCCH-type with G patch domain-containing protein-like isoform X2 n=1 Tax=Ylistrum balloti TaxID=509963 RepID=UPI002905DCDC|nr:zinc finger CCCH-type with G patch domain-containing protein-like isoform X2 [Ylistrum balloti]
MDESSIETSLELYKSQLSQVNQALQASGQNDDLVKLQADLLELIHLTEASLLSLKKSNLLKSLEQDDHVTEETTQHNSDDLDSEYAAFQAMLSDDVTSPNETLTQAASDSPEQDAIPLQTDDELKEMIGMKCRAAFVHDWGALSYHNAIISGVVPRTSTELIPKVSVMFCNPTHRSMLPCKYHLEGNCKFSNERCRFSHGHTVELDELKEFLEPDYSTLSLGGPCLAQYEDDLWYKAVIVDLHDDHQYSVTMDTYEGVHKLDIKHIIPLEQAEEMIDDEDNDAGDDKSAVPTPELSDDDDDELNLPVYLWKPPTMSQALGTWEAHTKGIGSKLMAKMGYVHGQGLGKREDGRVEPVPIQLLPPGKSLDTIMQLKEIAGEHDLFDVMKKREKKQKAQEKKQAQAYEEMKTKDQNVFDFMNRKLGGKKGNLKDLVPRHQNIKEPSSSGVHRNISEQDLNTKSERHLNIQLMKTDEEIKNVKKELERLKESLARNELRDKNVASRIRQKIATTEAYLQRLMTSGNAIQQHKQKRNNHKKLTVF